MNKIYNKPGISSLRMAILLLFIFVVFIFLCTVSASDLRIEEGKMAPEKLEIISAAFAFDPYSKANYDPFIKIRVFNSSEITITRALLKVTIKCDEGRELLFNDRFFYYANGGLKPNQAAVWILNPTNSSIWAMHNIPYDASIEVEVEKLQCPKKNTPWQPEYEHRLPKRHDWLQ